MTSDVHKRAYVYGMYPGKKWQHQVNRMPKEQITAIYLKHMNDGKPPEEYSESDIADDFPESALPHPVHSPGPHHNEDDFPSY